MKKKEIKKEVSEVENKKICCSCCSNIFKDMPCNLKFAYVLICISFLLHIFLFCCPNKFGKGGLFNKKISDWIANNPKAIIDSVQKFAQEEQRKYQEEQQAKSGENIVKFSKELKDTFNAGIINPKGTKELIEFFDYNCGYCKIAYKSVKELIEKRKDVKVILRPIAILGEPSQYATKIGFAILKMDSSKYIKYYEALMENSARTKEDVEKAVKESGLKLNKVEDYISKNNSIVEKLVSDNYELAGKIGINGTPAFIVNGKLIPGAIDADALSQELK